MGTGAGPSRPGFPARRRTPLFVGVMASALLIAGCGGRSSPSSSARPDAATTDFGGRVVAFAACMRSHGLPSYPDPQVSGRATTGASGSLPAASPAPRRSGLRRDRAATSFPAAEPRPQSASGSRRRTWSTQAACARTEFRASLTPIMTGCSRSRLESTSRRPCCSRRPKPVRECSQARSRSTINLQVAPERREQRHDHATAHTRSPVAAGAGRY